jgi:hypothetical protein
MDDLRRYRPLRREPRKVRLATQDRARGFKPVLDERALERGDHRALDADIGLTPVVFRPPIARPARAHADSSGESHPAIHDENAAVTPVVVLPEPEGTEHDQ